METKLLKVNTTSGFIRVGIVLCFVAMISLTSCSSDDGEMDENPQPEETVLELASLVGSWSASNFVFENSNSSLPDTNIIRDGDGVDLDIDNDGRFTFTFTFENDTDFTSSGQFRVVDNTLEALFDGDDDGNYRALESEVGEITLFIDGMGLFDLSGAGSQILLGFNGSFSRQ